MEYVNNYDYLEHVVQGRHVLSYLSIEYKGGFLETGFSFHFLSCYGNLVGNFYIVAIFLHLSSTFYLISTKSITV